MKRGVNNNAGEEDIPKTQLEGGFSSPPPSSEEGEGYYEPEGGDHPEPGIDMPEDPELGWYLSHWDMSDLAKIAVCRTYANYLSAKQPKNVESKGGVFTKKRVRTVKY